jgi:hypothetical protein
MSRLSCSGEGVQRLWDIRRQRTTGSSRSPLPFPARDPYLRARRRKLELRWQYADNREREESSVVVFHPRTTSETSSPQPFADQHCVLSDLTFLIGSETPAHYRRHPKQLKRVSRTRTLGRIEQPRASLNNEPAKTHFPASTAGDVQRESEPVCPARGNRVA